jgi:hypothetical protein
MQRHEIQVANCFTHVMCTEQNKCHMLLSLTVLLEVPHTDHRETVCRISFKKINKIVEMLKKRTNFFTKSSGYYYSCHNSVPLFNRLDLLYNKIGN